MEKEFNRSTVREISQRIQEVLSEFSKCGDYEYTINGGNFSADKAKLNLEVRIKNSDGTIVVSDYSHSIADSAASSSGLKFEGHLIGSTWNVMGDTYTVTGYNTKRRSYPVSLKREDGRLSKAPVMFLAQGTQVTKPTLEDFTKWFTLDPDSDAILESDVEICDRVQSYLENNYPIEDGDKFFNLVDKFNELDIAKKWAKRAYELLFKEASATMEHAYLGLKVIYKDVTKESKPRNVRKSAKNHQRNEYTGNNRSN